MIDGIKEMHGKCGNLVFSTRTKKLSNGKVERQVYARHYTKPERGAISDKEEHARSLFSRRQAEVTRRTHAIKEQYDRAVVAGLPTAGIYKSKQQIWAEVKAEITE